MILAAPVMNLDYNTLLTGTPIQFSNSISLIIFLSLLSVIPFFLISVTSFLRITVVLGMLRSAMGTQQSPPNMVIISLALFMTIFIMAPVWQDIKVNALDPFNKGKITQEQALVKTIEPIRQFMFKQVSEKDLALFSEFAKLDLKKIKSRDDIPTYVLIPAFMISELKKAFMISFVIFLPFVLIDLLVSNILLSLGMMMLSPVMISLPFKILFFVLVDGFNLIVKGLMESYSR
ncbi:MAG: flagellar type III secretion system pore protein FliP [Candidatus Margulisbacteria bacterium]|nr:flagellar type III secretion system pore protein FliP [Candidatus Margulisiibacteriota bacterium]